MSFVDECGGQPQEPNCLSMAGVSGSNRSARALVVAIAACLIVCAAWLTKLDKIVAGATTAPAKITVDYPLNGSVFPPDIAAPTFQWRDPVKSAVSWRIDVRGVPDRLRLDGLGSWWLVLHSAIVPQMGGVETGI